MISFADDIDSREELTDFLVLLHLCFIFRLHFYWSALINFIVGSRVIRKYKRRFLLGGIDNYITIPPHLLLLVLEVSDQILIDPMKNIFLQQQFLQMVVNQRTIGCELQYAVIDEFIEDGFDEF